MVQEIITFMIIGSAITLVVMKTVKGFVGKKSKTKNSPLNKMNQQTHNCAECSAECQLRDLSKYAIGKNLDECVKAEKKSKLLQS